MSKFDLSPKISFIDLISLLPFQAKELPFSLIKKELKISNNWKVNYFSWGRNALYYLFKDLPFKEITFPAFTCPVLTEAAEKAGKKVSLTEIDLATFNLDLNKIPKETKCLVVVHTFGNPVDIEQIRKQYKNIFIIEDCAHALFSKIGKDYPGQRGEAILFSLYKQTANINGALLLTKNKLKESQKQEKLSCNYKRLLIKVNGLHQYFLDIFKKQYLPKIEPQDLNSNQPSELSFSLFEKNFKKLATETTLRKKVASFYYQEAKQSPYFRCQQTSLPVDHSYCYFTIRLLPSLQEKRDKIVTSLREKCIFADRLWNKAPIALPQYKTYIKKCPQALLLSKTIINLPIFSTFTQKDSHYLFVQLNKAIEINL